MFSDRVIVCPVCGGRGEYREVYDCLKDIDAWVVRKCEDCEGRGWLELGGEE